MIRRSIRVTTVAFALFFGMALLAAVAPPVAAQADDEQTINATVEYHLEPDDPERVLVEVTFEDLDNIDDLHVLEIGMDEVVEDDIEGFEEGSNSEWELVDGAETATIPYYLELDRTTTVTFSRSVFSSDGEWALIDQDEPYATSDANISYSQTTPDGVVPEHESHVYLKDDLEVASADTADASVTVIGTPEEMAESPQEVADALAAMTDAVEYGEVDKHITAYAVPNLGEYFLQGTVLSDSSHATESDDSIYDTRSFWFHEQVHLVDGTDVDSDLNWFTEGYANYGAVLYGMETGYQDFTQYRNHLEDWGGDRVVLADIAEDDNEDYTQGPRVLAALDYEIRKATDGEATIEDVVREMHDHDGSLSHEEFIDIVADVANEDVADETDTWLTTTEPILEDGVWDYEEHAAVFGPAANVERTVAVTIEGEDTKRTVEFDDEFEEWMVVREDETVTVEIVVENTGDEPVTTQISVHDFGRSVEDRTTTTLEPGASDTMVRTYEFDADENNQLFIGEFGRLLVDGTSADAAVVDGHPAGADPDDPILLEDDQDVTVGAGMNNSGTLGTEGDITIETLDGEVVAEKSAQHTARTTTTDSEQFDRSTTYAVTFDYFGDERTRYVSTLDPVNDTVPVDRNGDGLHRDIDGDGTVTHDDVSLFQEVIDEDAIQAHPAAYDFDGDGTIGYGDANALMRDV